MNYETVLSETQDHVLLLTLNRPSKLNAINGKMREEVHAVMDAAWRDDEVRAVVVAASGRGFCAGADITGDRPQRGESQNERLDDESWAGQWARLFWEFDKPIVAAVGGIAAGAGMSLALAADLRVGSEKAAFKSAFIERSYAPEAGVSFFLPRIVGYARAADVLFTSRTIDALEAFRLGLLDRLVKSDVLVAEAIALAHAMTRWPPMALRATKRVLQRNLEAGFDQVLKNERGAQEFATRAPKDLLEARFAFQEKRTPLFTGS